MMDSYSWAIDPISYYLCSHICIDHHIKKQQNKQYKERKKKVSKCI